MSFLNKLGKITALPTAYVGFHYGRQKYWDYNYNKGSIHPQMQKLKDSLHQNNVNLNQVAKDVRKMSTIYKSGHPIWRSTAKDVEIRQYGDEMDTGFIQDCLIFDILPINK